MADTAIDCDDCRASTGSRCWKHPLSTGYNLPVADAPLDPTITRQMLELDRDRQRARAEAAEKLAVLMEWAACEMANDFSEAVQLLSQMQCDEAEEGGLLLEVGRLTQGEPDAAEGKEAERSNKP